MKKRVAVIGENAVQKSLLKILRSEKIDSELLENAEITSKKGVLRSFDCIVLPFPSKGENISFIRENYCKSLFADSQIVIGGMIDTEVKKHIEGNGTEVIDYFLDDAYVLKNAYLTYQGVLRLLLENTDTFLAGKTAIVTGFGRIAKPLCLALKSIGLKVYVAVRSEIQTAEAQMLGFDVLKISNIKGAAFYFDFIFNTVPSEIFTEKDIRHLRDSAVYFEIASKPYGADSESFGLYGKKHIPASALPGKFYPLGVAENIAHFLSVRGVI